MNAPAHNATATAQTTLCAALVRPLCVAAIAAALGLPSAQAGDFYLKIDGIDGEAVDDNAKHDKWIGVDALFHGAASPMAEGRRVATLGDVSISKSWDKATPKLNEAASKGKVIDKVEIYGTTTTSGDDKTRVPYFQWELKNVQITSYQSNPGDDSETVTLGGFTAGNLVQHTYDGDGQPSGRVVDSFRVDPHTGLANFDHVDPSVRMKGGLRLQPVGTPNVVDEDDDGDGVADRVRLTSLGSTGLDGYQVSLHGKETTHNIEFRRGDPNNDAHVTVSAAYGKDGKKGGNVETTWKVEEGTLIARKKRELRADFSDVGASQYEYTIQSGGEVVAQGVASDIDALVLEGVACDGGSPHCDPMTANESVSLNYETIKWTYSKLDRGVLPDGEEIELDPTIATSVSLRPVGGHLVVGPLSSSRLTFANFESVDVHRVSAIPEPGALVLTAIAAAFAASGRRGHRTNAV